MGALVTGPAGDRGTPWSVTRLDRGDLMIKEGDEYAATVAIVQQGGPIESQEFIRVVRTARAKRMVRLLNAVPQMEAALREIVDGWEGDASVSDLGDIIDKARSALARARGEEVSR